MTTKDQERKALAKIREIVDGLGANSYVGTAMEGVWEMAQENIDCDFALSMKDRLEAPMKECDDLRDRIVALNSDKTDLTNRLAKAEKTIADNNKMIDNVMKNMKATSDELDVKMYALAESEKRIEAMQDEIIRLKAKLYDLMVKEG